MGKNSDYKFKIVPRTINGKTAFIVVDKDDKPIESDILKMGYTKRNDMGNLVVGRIEFYFEDKENLLPYGDYSLGVDEYPHRKDS